jgi:hypothetical protein
MPDKPDSNLPIIACDRCGTWNPLTLVNVGEVDGGNGDPWRSYYREARCRCGAYLELSASWAIPRAERRHNWWDALRRTTRHDG